MKSNKMSLPQRINKPIKHRSTVKEKNGSKLNDKQTINLLNSSKTTNLQAANSTIELTNVINKTKNRTSSSSSIHSSIQIPNKMVTINNVLPKITNNLPTVTSFNEDLTMFSTTHHHFESPQQAKLKFQNINQNLPQQFKVEQKNSTFYLIPTNLTSASKSNLNKSSPARTMDPFLNEFNSSTNIEKKLMNKELIDLLNNLKKLTEQLESKVNGRLNDVDLIVKKE